MGYGLEAGWEIAPVRHSFLKLPGVTPRENAGTTRTALGIRREGVPEQHAFASDAVKVRCLHPITTIGTGMRAVPIVKDNEEDVGPQVRL